jgi:hypothetical protein
MTALGLGPVSLNWTSATILVVVVSWISQTFL